jgi:hypothetical protein
LLFPGNIQGILWGVFIENEMYLRGQDIKHAELGGFGWE